MTNGLSMRARGIAMVLVCAAAAPALPRVSLAQPSVAVEAAPDDAAFSPQDEGTRLFEAGRYEEAIAEFRKAYELEARPTLLLQIGRAYQRLGQRETALYFFQRFLATAPSDSPDRAEAEAVVAAAAPPAAPPVADDAPMEPALGALDVRERAPAAETETDTALWQRWWFWVGVGAVAAAGAGWGFGLFGGEAVDVPQSDLGHRKFE